MGLDAEIVGTNDDEYGESKFEYWKIDSVTSYGENDGAENGDQADDEPKLEPFDGMILNGVITEEPFNE